MATSQIQREALMAKTIRSLGHRWGVMMPILSKSPQPNNREFTPSTLTEKALAKIEKRHTATVSDLLRGWDKTGREKLVAEIMAADSEVVRSFFTTDMSLNEARTAMETRLCSPLNQPAESPVSSVVELKPDIPVAGDMSADKTAKESTPILSDEELLSTAAAFALKEIEGYKCDHPGNQMVGPKLIENLKRLEPRMDKAATQRLVEILKNHAGSRFVEFDDDDDIPF